MWIATTTTSHGCFELSNFALMSQLFLLQPFLLHLLFLQYSLLSTLLSHTHCFLYLQTFNVNESYVNMNESNDNVNLSNVNMNESNVNMNESNFNVNEINANINKSQISFYRSLHFLLWGSTAFFYWLCYFILSPLCSAGICDAVFWTVITVTEARNYGALLNTDGINKNDQINLNSIMILFPFYLIPKSAWYWTIITGRTVFNAGGSS